MAQTFDIPINIKVSCETEEQAEDIVSHALKHLVDGSALTRRIQEWDFIIFAYEEEERGDAAETAPSI